MHLTDSRRVPSLQEWSATILGGSSLADQQSATRHSATGARLHAKPRNTGRWVLSFGLVMALTLSVVIIPQIASFVKL
jgi:hypothetical protein